MGGAKRYKLQYPKKIVNFNSIFAREQWGTRPRKGCGPDSIINRVGLLRVYIAERYRHKLAKAFPFPSAVLSRMDRQALSS
jgi:hypothetical protein